MGQNNLELRLCPICGKTVKVYSPKDRHHTSHNPHSDGYPYNIECECGLSFCVDSYDFEETAEAWNKQMSVQQYVLDQIMWERDVALKQLAEISKGLGEKMDDIVCEIVVGDIEA